MGNRKRRTSALLIAILTALTTPAPPEEKVEGACPMCGHSGKFDTGECNFCGVAQCTECKKYRIGPVAQPCRGFCINLEIPA